MYFTAHDVTPETLLAEVQTLFDKKYRFITMSQTVVDEQTLRLYYHFDENITMTDLRLNADRCRWIPGEDNKGMLHLRMDVDRDAPIPSISSIYFCAVLIENETQDQFGVHFDGLPLDYQGALYLEEGEVTRAPFFTMSTTRKPAPKASTGEQA